MRYVSFVLIALVPLGCDNTAADKAAGDGYRSATSAATGDSASPGAAEEKKTGASGEVSKNGSEANAAAAGDGKSSQQARASQAAKASADAVVELMELDYEGIQKLIASHKGKVVVLDCWATYCAPCVEEFPSLVELHQKYGPEKLACISLSFDNEGIDPLEEIKPVLLDFLRQQKATFDNVVSTEENTVLYEKMGFSAVPAIFVYDQQGELVKVFKDSPDGAVSYDDVKPLVAKLIEGES